MNKVVSAVHYQGALLVFMEDGTIYELIRSGVGWVMKKEVIQIPTRLP